MRLSNPKTFILLLVISITGFTTEVSANIADKTEVKSFIDEMVGKHQFDRQSLVSLFEKVEIKDKIIQAIKRPAEGKPWYQYRTIFMTDKRIREGVKFWNEHADTLARATQTYGVPEQVIVAILGVETSYGKHKGRFRVMDSLSTLAFAYPKRSSFFKSELEQYLLLTRDEKVDPLSLTGSYAGAMGKPQFISSSYRRYAVDFDGDGKRDLLDNFDDAIGSVANYFNQHQWVAGDPIATPAQVVGSDFKSILENGIKPQQPLSELLKKGVSVFSDFPMDQNSALIDFELKAGHEYWVGFDNFYVITRYNHSELYAMAAFQLGRAIVEQRRLEQASNTNAVAEIK